MRQEETLLKECTFAFVYIDINVFTPVKSTSSCVGLSRLAKLLPGDEQHNSTGATTVNVVDALFSKFEFVQTRRQ